MAEGHPARAVADVPLRTLLRAIAAAEPAPGAGAAAGVALALGAACAAKAVTLSLRHRAADTDLAAARAELDLLMGAALDAARLDGDRFTAWLARPEKPETQELMQVEQELIRLAQALDSTLHGLRGHIEPTLLGDLEAAAALAQAGRRIQARNLKETRGAAERD